MAGCAMIGQSVQRSERFSLERIDRNHDHHRDQRCHRDLRHVGAECAGQGVANIASGFLGGMAGCAMIGQSVINVSSGGIGTY
jgi:predicted lipid-binding transport protein (Tim44 family)